ncbi:MAG: acyl transferase [Bacteroidota bacterium]
MVDNLLRTTVLGVNEHNFETVALEIFRYQSIHCEVYNRYIKHLQLDTTKITRIEDIPYLPIMFFKNFEVCTNQFEPQIIFESSSTTGTGISKHYVKSLDWYNTAFRKSFEHAFGSPDNFCHLALLPGYLERSNSSLVYQVNDFISKSQFSESGFYLNNLTTLAQQLTTNIEQQIPTVLWGVSFALLDFAENHKIDLSNIRIIETGGMKGRRKEITRAEMHGILNTAFNTDYISGEYGMTELMSQAYADKAGLFTCAPWMKVKGREINDPLTPAFPGKHCVLNIIDLANIDSCAFIATDDIGKIDTVGRFEVLGRLDNSDTRGCNLLIA